LEGGFSEGDLADHMPMNDVNVGLDELYGRIADLEGQLKITKAFHDLAVKERDFERVRVNRLEKENQHLHMILDGAYG
jgi:hypothetical protein